MSLCECACVHMTRGRIGAYRGVTRACRGVYVSIYLCECEYMSLCECVCVHMIRGSTGAYRGSPGRAGGSPNGQKSNTFYNRDLISKEVRKMWGHCSNKYQHSI